MKKEEEEALFFLLFFYGLTGRWRPRWRRPHRCRRIDSVPRPSLPLTSSHCCCCCVALRARCDC